MEIKCACRTVNGGRGPGVDRLCNCFVPSLLVRSALPPPTPRRTLRASYRSREDSSMTTPAHLVPASQLARSARSEEIVAKHKKYLWPSVTNYFQQPLAADRGEMQHLWDVDGNKYLDFFGEILTVSGGHSNTKVTTKVTLHANPLRHTSPPF